MVHEFRTKNVAFLSYRLFVENYFHIIYIAIKKCYYEGPTFKLCGGPGVPLLNFEGGPGVPLLNFEGGPRVLVSLLHHAKIPDVSE